MSDEYARTDLTGTDFRSTDLTGQSLVHSDITNCKFGNCKGVKFICARGENADFKGSDISDATFEKVSPTVLPCLIGAIWNRTEVKQVSGWLVTEGYWTFVTNAFVQCGCMVRTIQEWCRICESMETIQELGLPPNELVDAFNWWQKNSALLIECSNNFAVME